MFISFQHRIGLAGKCEENRSQVGIINRGDLLLMVKKGIRDRICHAANRCLKVNNKCMTDYYSSTESSYLGGCQQSIWTNDATKVACRWLKKILNLLRNSYKTMAMTATNDISLRLMLVILSVDKRYIAISHPCLKEWRLINARNMFVICMASKTVSCT